MHTPAQVVQSFYEAFQKKDFTAMGACYADNATFSDPVFTQLNAMQVRAMWEMFCKNGKDLHVEFKILSSDADSCTAEWVATYLFSASGRKVINRITAHFTFDSGLIMRHEDSFSFYSWARQALGTSGLLLGWTTFLRQKVRTSALQSLSRFIAKKRD